MSTSLVVWIGVVVTLAMISFMFKSDNPLYQYAQYAFLGVAAGNAVVVGWGNFNTQALKPLMSGQAAYAIPIIAGLLLFSRYIPGFQWLSRYPMAFLVASGAGIGLAGAVQAQFITQLNATFLNLTKLDNLLLFLGVFAVISCFFFTESFTRPLTGPGQAVTKFGRWVMMIGFGATFGNAVMGRFTLLIGRLQFLLTTWLGM